MKRTARLVTRGSGTDGNGPVDLILGVGMKSGILKPYTVYEIREVLGELLIEEMGPSHLTRQDWNHDASYLLEVKSPYLFLTQEEYIEQCEKSK